MSKKRKLISSFLLITIVTCLAIFAIESQTKIFRRAIDNFVFDNWNHYLPCSKLPSELEVNTIFRQHLDVISSIEQINPGMVGVEVDSSTCPGKADLVIWYPSHTDRLAIERNIASGTFFGIPYRLQNR
jgi:hypothetical protein